jgi:endonuclease/exonuclease/phosphatase family metal-dependent hydrolase
MKFLYIIFFLSIAGCSTQEVKNGPIVSDADLHLGTWNIRILSTGSRDDSELETIASIMSEYDLLAIQEVRDYAVLDRLLEYLPEYSCYASQQVGTTTQKEIYGFVYKTDKVELLGTPYIYEDLGSDFIREPLIGNFRYGEFDFTLVTIHVIYGDSVTQRREEVSLLPQVLELVDVNNGPENDIILLGDFNLPPEDSAWGTAGLSLYSPILTGDIKTTISDTSSYDNLWFNRSFVTEWKGDAYLYKFDEVIYGNDDDQASLEVSDHRPVSAYFVTSFDDDIEGTW